MVTSLPAINIDAHLIEQELLAIEDLTSGNPKDSFYWIGRVTGITDVGRPIIEKDVLVIRTLTGECKIKYNQNDER